MSSLPQASGWFHVQASVVIQAPVEHVWAVLVDWPRYHEWNTFVPQMDSSFQVGATLTMHVQFPHGLRTTSVETITALDEHQKLAWKTRSPAWLLSGERLQILTRLDEETTQYWTQESFAGLLAPLLQLLLGRQLQRGFAAVARDLKARAESTQ